MLMKLRNKLIPLIILAAFSLGFAACKELFDPEVDFIEPLIVVDGLITDQEKEHLVKIHYSLNYNDVNAPEPVSQAEVLINDENGNSFQLIEKEPGHYFTEEGFSAQTGSSYELIINTADGLELRSRPQLVLPVEGIDSIHGRFATKHILEQNSYGDLFYSSYQGTDSHIDIKDSNQELPKMRYEPRILLLYGFWTADTSSTPGPPVMMYCWRKYGSGGLPSVNFTDLQAGQSGLKNHLLTFVPDDDSFYRLLENEFTVGKYILVRQFRLNDDSHSFHRALASQLSAEGNLFDPIASQLPGNIECVSDPSIKVLGLFEASATISETFRYISFPAIQEITYIPFTDLDHLPNSGQMLDQEPFFW